MLALGVQASFSSEPSLLKSPTWCQDGPRGPSKQSPRCPAASPGPPPTGHLPPGTLMASSGTTSREQAIHTPHSGLMAFCLASNAALNFTIKKLFKHLKAVATRGSQTEVDKSPVQHTRRAQPRSVPAPAVGVGGPRLPRLSTWAPPPPCGLCAESAPRALALKSGFDLLTQTHC